MTAKEAKDSGVDNRRRFFRVIGAKVNLALPPEAGIWRQLVSIPLSNGRDGDPGDCVQVATQWQRPSSSQALEAPDLILSHHPARATA
jgi:hypothetical protein